MEMEMEMNTVQREKAAFRSSKPKRTILHPDRSSRPGDWSISFGGLLAFLPACDAVVGRGREEEGHLTTASPHFADSSTFFRHSGRSAHENKKVGE